MSKLDDFKYWCGKHKVETLIGPTPEAYDAAFEVWKIMDENAAQQIKALGSFMQIRWMSIDKDNMEFNGKATCFQLEAARRALANLPKELRDDNT